MLKNIKNILRRQFANFHNKLECLSPPGLFILVQCLWVWPVAKTRAEHQKDASLRFAPALLTNIRPGVNLIKLFWRKFNHTFL